MKTHEERQTFLAALVRKVLSKAIENDMIVNAEQFSERLDVRFQEKENAWAKLGKGRTPVMMLSTHDRDLDPHTYAEKVLAPRSLNGRKSSWTRATEMARQGYAVYVEYSKIQYDKEIGMFVTKGDDSPEIHSLTTICHELAHCIHMWNHVHKRAPRGPLGSGHGVEWQAIYRRLRNLLVNDRVDISFLYETKVAARNLNASVKPPKSGVTQQVWDICDANSKCSRGELIDICIASGISPGTAATQYAKWNRHRNI